MNFNIEKKLNKEKMRISKEAKKKMIGLIEEKTEEIMKKLIKIARYNGRKTIKEKDFEMLAEHQE